MRLYRALDELVAGTHACALYATSDEYHRTVAAYVRTGVENGQRVVCLSGGETEVALREAIKREGLSVARLIQAGSLKLVSTAAAHAKGGPLAPRSTAKWLREQEAGASRAGRTGIWVSMDMSWAIGPEVSESDVLAVENRLNRHLPGTRAVALCHYDLSRFTPGLVLAALDAHPYVLVESGIVPNPTYGAGAKDQVARAILDGRLAALGFRAAMDEPTQVMAETSGPIFRALANAAPAMIWMSDASGACTFINESWLTFTGRAFHEEVGGGWMEVVHPEDVDRLFTVFRESLNAGRPFEVNCRMRRADGVFRWVMDRALPMPAKTESSLDSLERP